MRCTCIGLVEQGVLAAKVSLCICFAFGDHMCFCLFSFDDHMSFYLRNWFLEDVLFVFVVLYSEYEYVTVLFIYL